MKYNIVSDPKGWASKMVGSPLAYRLTQFLTLLQGAALAFILYVICHEAQVPLFGYLLVLVFLGIAVVELPLLYLRALRFYVVEQSGCKHESS